MSTKPAQNVAPQTATDVVIPAGPEARRLARELGVNLSRVAASGKRGRITADDVRAAAESAQSFARPAAGSADKATSADAFGPVRRERLSALRWTIATQMSKSASTIPHVTNFDDADVTELEQMRKTISADKPGSAATITALPFVLRAVALALRQHPTLNASLDEENQEVIYRQYVNVGVAIDTPRGTLVPVLRNVDDLSVLDIARELSALAVRARLGNVQSDDLRVGTFTVSNLGAVGGLYSTPLISHPEVAILLLGRSRQMPVVCDDAIESRLMMPLSLSYDCRVVDGAAAARFLSDVIASLGTPGSLLLTN